MITDFMTDDGRHTLTASAGGRVIGRRTVNIQDNNIWVEFRVSSGFGLVDDPTPTMAADLYEANNSQTEAANLGTVTPLTPIGGTTALSIHSTSDEDWFKFNVVGRGARANIQIGFKYADGDIDAILYRLETDGTLTAIIGGYSTNDDELISRDLAPGTYFLKIYGYNEATNFYSLTADVAHQAASADLVGYHRGAWFIGASTGASFATTRAATWTDARWDALKQGNFNEDGRTDVLGLFDGSWFVGLSNGTTFATSPWAKWANVDWQDVTVGDLNGDGLDDILARFAGHWYAALSYGTGFGSPAVWGRWADVDWKHVQLVDLDADGDDDLLAYLNGNWWVGQSNGSTFQTSRWTKWANAAWHALGTFDANGDGRTDIYGFVNGNWYVGYSTGTGFTTAHRVGWANVAWKHVVAGDFNGDGRDDLAARVRGAWWVSESSASGAAGPTRLWARWANLAWKNILVADFDGDGRDDILGRYTDDWYVASSIGASFITSRWATWANVNWYVFAFDTGEPTVAAAAPAPTASPRASATLLALEAEDESITRFWASADDDDELSRELLALATTEPDPTDL